MQYTLLIVQNGSFILCFSVFDEVYVFANYLYEANISTISIAEVNKLDFPKKNDKFRTSEIKETIMKKIDMNKAPAFDFIDGKVLQKFL